MNFNFFKFVFAGIFALFLIGFLFKGYIIGNNIMKGEHLYVIRVPDYSGNYEEYLAKDYIEKDGCIKFEDEFGFKQKICGNYTVEGW